jgi:outer membrane protein assembly complex protein YaeT
MIGLTTLTALTLALALVPESGPERFTGRLVNGVEIASSRGPLSDTARGLVDVRAGDPYDPAAVRRSIKRLYALGTFSDIKVDARPEGDGVSLTFHLYPRLTIGEVLLSEASMTSPEVVSMREDLLDAAGLVVEEPFDAIRVEHAAGRMEGLLRRKGFLWARVDPEARFRAADAQVVFHIEIGAQAKVSEIGIQGVPPHAQQDIRRQIGLKPGDLYDEETLTKRLDAIVKRWKDKRFYQAKLESEESPEPPDHVSVVIHGEIGPRVIVETTGAELSGKMLNRLVPVEKEASVSEDLIEESRANIEGHFRDRGFLDASVTVEREWVDRRRLTLSFRIETGKRLQVGSILLEGMSDIEEAKVRSLLTTRPRGRLRSSPYVPGKWEEDLKEVRRYLLQQGYHRARVTSEVKELEQEPGEVELILHVEEGPRAYLTSIGVEGASQIGADEIVANSGLQVGGVFDASTLVGSRERTINLYRNRGFRQVVVELATELDDSGTRGTANLLIHEGAQTRVDRVIITGLDQTKEKAVRPYVALTPHQPLSAQDLLETRQRLIGTGLFRDVSIEVLPPDPSTRSSDILIDLKEAPRTTVGYGFGYSERDLARVEGQITRHNILGMNRSASVFARASFRSNRLVFSYQQPDTFGLELPSFVSAVREEGERADFKFKRLGIGMQVLKRLSRTETLFFRYSLEDVDLLEEPEKPPPPEFRPSFISKVSVSSVSDTRDDPVSPARGQFRILDFDLSAKFLGTHSPFIKGLAQQFFYFPLPSDMVFVLALRGGIGQTFREDRDALLPITERFFAGGANTLRGFALDEASPKNRETGEPVGGNVLMLLNLELRFPIANRMGGVVFSDNGNVYRRLQVIRLLNWRYNAGIGLRYETPIGPVRVDYGIKLNRRPGESFGRLHVSLGHPF